MTSPLDTETRPVLTHEDLPGVRFVLQYVTPELAHFWLTKNSPNQRTLSQEAVDRYGEDMDAGDWVFAGDPIRFDTEDNLIDGQHRLNAIRESGQSQLLVVIFGLDPTIVAAIDGGKKRSYADFLKMQFKVSSPNHMSALVRSLWYWDEGCYGMRGVGRISNPSSLYAHPSTQQLEHTRLRVQEKAQLDLSAAITFGARARKQMPALTMNTWALGWVLLTYYDPYQRDEFFYELLVEPKVPDAEYPVNGLKNRLLREGQNSLTRQQQLHFLMTAFNAWHQSEPKGTFREASPVRFNTLAMPPVKERS